MAYGATAELDAFDEAIAWFRKRVPVTESEFEEMTSAAQSRAFYLAGVEDLRVVETVYKEIDRALEKGTSLDDFQLRVTKALKRHAPSGDQLETVFRVAVQGAYNAGRWEQLEDPDVKRARPYRIYDATLDTRTTDLCRGLDGICLPADSTFWSTHWPPMHVRCRSGVRSATKAQAQAHGITRSAPLAQADDGFGLAPPLQGAYEVDEGDVHPDLYRVFRRKQDDDDGD